MIERVIPLHDLRWPGLGWPASEARGSAAPLGDPLVNPLTDRLGRPLHDLRISVTDRCNFRCSYCMPREVFDVDHAFLPQSALLSFEEITRAARLFVAQGVRKIRLTGGEPLLRKHLERLVSMLAALRGPDGEGVELTLTTNGTLLAHKAQALKDAGLRRVTVSLDALDDILFRRINDAGVSVERVLEGIEEARRAGLGPIKVNMVVRRGLNDHEIEPMARFFREAFDSSVVLRFIEYMDVGTSNGWRMRDVVPSTEVLARLAAVHPLEPVERRIGGETARRWRWSDGRGEIGVISSVTNAFCGDCSRARLSTEGRLYLCLFAHHGHDLRALLRNGASDEEIVSALAQVWRQRADRYSELRGTEAALEAGAGKRIEMHYIGG